MTDYEAIRKEIMEKHSESFKELYISELKDQIAEKNAEIESLQIRIKDLERQLSNASWTAEMYRNQIDDRPKW